MKSDGRPESELAMDEEVPFIERYNQLHGRRSRGILKSPLLPWCLFATLSAYVLLNTAILASQRTSGLNLWSQSDFVSSRWAIELIDRKFTSSLDFIDRKHIFRITDPSTPLYVGNASTSLDQNWDNLILPADIYISDDEASSLPKDVQLYRSPEIGLYKIELEVFHSLHCLNMIRMRLYGEQYPEMLTENGRVHVDHCIESLRELIMCEGNMTPIPIEWSEKGERINPNYAQKHSCRNFDALKQWTKHRAANPPIQ